MVSEKLLPEAGAGIDCGTGNFVSSRQIGKKIILNRIRNAFIDLPMEHKRMLKLSKTSFFEYSGKLVVIGDDALATANLFNRESRRPMKGGIIASGELEAQEIIGLIMKTMLGEPSIINERCCYSVPAIAVDTEGSDITYHQAILGKIITEIGFQPIPVNESLAIIFSECAKENFSGLGVSYGAGMTNICLAYNTLSALEFSLNKGGDFVDIGASKAVGTTAAKICSIKENNLFDMNNPISREQEAIVLYLQTLIDYTIKNIIQHFSKVKRDIMIPKPIPIIISGGTSLAKGFVDKFKERFELNQKDFPISISEIRPAADPITAVAAGLLMVSQAED